ncbi:FAD-binding domain-containing protein [Tothia fuscella]|uniref:FAD-binding domain-containing protein n=1 Tax=Tothia fuscella TaxID=1048955 RepID=A0A9P4TSY3_9PEZI|nr:FAD-binding domain-containing protein [Tothia fuscella]
MLHSIYSVSVFCVFLSFDVRRSSTSSNCELACASIAESIPHAFFLRDEGVNTLWDSKQSDVIPACRVEPSNPEEVSIILKATIEEQCHFAIRGGGHSRISGSSNAEKGITVDLKTFNFIEIGKDKKTVRIGGGSVWGDVYRALEKERLMVVGGRVSDVGVGGLTLGGGISFFSNKRGWACDSVTAFEVVLPNTSVQIVTKDSNLDVYWALRGGGNSFGVVTAFHMELFERKPEIWRGMRMYTFDKIPELLAAQHKFVTEVQAQDPDAVAFFPYGYHQPYDLLMSMPTMVHGTHNSNETWPAAFDDFKAIEGIPDSTSIVHKPLSDCTDDVALMNPYGMRTIYQTITYKVSTEVDRKILEIYQEELQPIKSLEGAVPFIIFHPTPAGHTDPMKKNGGNPLGLAGLGPLMIMQTSWMWKNKADDEAFYESNRSIFERATAVAREAGVLVPYIYQNYAWESQDVFAGYGKENQARLKKIQSQIDPDGVFAGGEGLSKGYFKVNMKGKHGNTKAQQTKDEL